MKTLRQLFPVIYLWAIVGFCGGFVANAKTFTLHMKGKGRLLEFHELEEIRAFKNLPDDIRSIIFDVNTYCYRVPLRDPENGFREGTGYHCVTRVDLGNQVVTSLEFVVFRLLDGIIVARMNTTAQKNLTGNTNAITHLIGFFPQEYNILFGTKRFNDVKGRVRLSGGVNLNKFPETVRFDSFYVLNYHR